MDHIHQELDEGCLAGSVVTDEGEDGSARDGEGQGVQGLGLAVALGEGVSLDGGILAQHECLGSKRWGLLEASMRGALSHGGVEGELAAVMLGLGLCEGGS